MNFFLPSCSPHAPSDARHFPVSFDTWLDRDGALTYYSYGHINRYRIRGQTRGQQDVGPFLQQKWPDRDTVGQVISPNRYRVLIGWLSALGKRASTVSIYREESMVILARSRDWVGKNREKGKKVLAR